MKRLTCLLAAIGLLCLAPAAAHADEALETFTPHPVSAEEQAALRAFEPAFAAGFPDELRQQLDIDLGFFSSMRASGATPLHRQIFGDVPGPAYFRYLAERIKTVASGSCGALSAVACVKPKKDPSKMWIGPGYTQLRLPQMYRLMVVIHEARHTEADNDFWLHEDCPKPFKDEKGDDIKGIFSGTLLEGLPACDTTPIGAYGVGLIMLKNVDRFCANCTDKVRMDAELSSDDTLKRISDRDAQQVLVDDLYR